MKEELERLIDEMIAHGILFDEAVREFEKQFILRVIERHRHNLSRAAVELGIHRHTLARRMAEYQDKGAADRPREI